MIKYGHGSQYKDGRTVADNAYLRAQFRQQVEEESRQLRRREIAALEEANQIEREKLRQAKRG